MAVYKWRIPMLAAVQFDGKNHKAVKELIGDDSEEKEKFMLHTGKFEEPEAQPQPEAEGQPEGTEGTQSGEVQGDQQQVPGGATGDDSSRGTTGDAEKEAPEPPKEILEELTVSEGDWVTKDVANGKVEVNPEGFPEKYEFISA
jgi:hypothetical protein